MNGKHYDPEKDDFFFNTEQNQLTEIEEKEKRIYSAIQDTIKSYWKEPLIMVDMIRVIKPDITAEECYELLIDEYVKLQKIENAINRDDFDSFVYGYIFNNIKSLIITILDLSFDNQNMEILKNKILK